MNPSRIVASFAHFALISVCFFVCQSAQLSSLESDLAKREERIFRDFSRRVGVANIREFENERLKLAEQYVKQKLQVQTEVSNLQNQLEYERNRDLQSPIDESKQRLAALEAKLRDAKKEESKLEEEMDKEKKKVEQMIAENQSTAKEMDAKQNELKEAKKKGQQLMHNQPVASVCLRSPPCFAHSLTHPFFAFLVWCASFRHGV